MNLLKSKWFNALDTETVSGTEMVVGASLYAITAHWTGAPNDGATVVLQGSLDGENWVTLGSVIKSGGASSASAWITDRPAAFIRLNNAEMNEGTFPTVTVSVLAQ
jgi:hypothetical protein